MTFATLFRVTLPVLFLGVAASRAHAGERALIDTSKSPHARMYMVDIDDVQWTKGLLAERYEACRTVMIPHMWTIFKDPHESHAWDNFLMAAGLGEGRGDGKPHGPPFNDGDFLKWLEALAQVYALTRDPQIDAEMDRIIEVVAKAQREDGYLHTHKIIPQRRGNAQAREFEDREHFETYNMGHLITTACVHYRATGKTNLLTLARKAADYIEKLSLTVPDDLARNAICPSHYMGVIELYRVTREPRYLELGKRLLEIRRLVTPKDGSDHNQDRIPFQQQREAVGHAVRANYLYAGAADVYAESGDAELMASLDAIANDVVTQKLYITGMTGALYDGASPDGSTQHSQIKTVHQAYGRDYQLPNLTAYNETCATIGYFMWKWRMLTLTGDARFGDLLEQSFYNGVLPGISLEGKHYFYVNPLRKEEGFNWPLRWSRTRTPNIKSSFCCPPNVLRTIAEAHNYVYSLSPDTVWVHLYAGSTLATEWVDGGRVALIQETDYPWDGAIKITLKEVPEKAVALKLRIPGWVGKKPVTARVNGEKWAGDVTPGTYLEIKRTWRAGDEVELMLPMSPTLWEAHPFVEEARSQVALRVGPLVYCAESNDLPPGVSLRDVVLPLSDALKDPREDWDNIAGTRVQSLTLRGQRRVQEAWSENELYRSVDAPTWEPITVKFVPYYAWGNRGSTDMSVWIPAR
jgi:uncharacterized protein